MTCHRRCSASPHSSARGLCARAAWAWLRPPHPATARGFCAQIDKDGDGELTTEELSTLLDANRKFKARNT